MAFLSGHRSVFPSKAHVAKYTANMYKIKILYFATMFSLINYAVRFIDYILMDCVHSLNYRLT